MEIRQYQYVRSFCSVLLLRLVCLFVLTLLAVKISVIAGEQNEYEMINFTAGQIGIMDNLDGPQRYGLAYRFTSFSGPGGFRLFPAIGATVTRNGARFFYADLRHDFFLDQRWLLVPSLGIGLFNESKEIDLGSDIEFRSGLELAYQFSNRVRAGLAIFHLSNAGLSNDNPGTEALVFHLCIPVKD